MSNITFVEPATLWKEYEQRCFGQAIKLEKIARQLIADRYNIAEELGHPVKLIIPDNTYNCYCLLYHSDDLATVALGNTETNNIALMQYSYNNSYGNWIAARTEYQKETISIYQLVEKMA